jgi:endonuclease/exonuclease/phosphatase family metal-dependent hydrolase
MKLISLNTWGGRSFYPLIDFFKHKAAETDIFCLQEIFHTDQKELDDRHPEELLRGDLFKKITETLGDFDGHFASFEDKPHLQSLAMFIKKSLTVRESGDFLVHVPKQPKERGSIVLSSRKLQYARVGGAGAEHTVINFHGLWMPGPKTDTQERLTQSEEVKMFLKGTNGPNVLCGDFNLLPETEAMAILEENMRNLVKEYAVPSTRTVLYRHYDDPKEPNFADYVLVSPGVAVREFKVLPDIVSDHSPLYLEYEII